MMDPEQLAALSPHMHADMDGDLRSISCRQRYDTETGLYTNVDDNSGRWRTRGLELIAEARPFPGLDLGASLTWQRTEDRSSGIDPGYSPNLLAKLKASWSSGHMTYAAYADYVGAMDADWDFVSGSEASVVERIGKRVPAYWNVGLSLRWDPIGAGPYAALNVSNLLDLADCFDCDKDPDSDSGSGYRDRSLRSGASRETLAVLISWRFNCSFQVSGFEGRAASCESG